MSPFTKKRNTIENYIDDLFETINQLSILLLDANPSTFEQRLFNAMGFVARTVDVDRMYIWKNFLIDGKLYSTQLYEWSGGAKPVQDTDLTVRIPYDEILVGLDKVLSSGECVNSIVREMAPRVREHLEKQNIVSIILEPIFIKGEFWGFVGFDDCHNERTFTDNEERMLKTCAHLFGHACYQNEVSRLIHKQAEFQKVVFDESPIGLNIHDMEMNSIDCNLTLAKMLGVSKEKIIHHFFDFVPEYQPDGMKSVDRVRDQFRRVKHTKTQTTEWSYLLPNGKQLPCKVTLKYVNYEHKPFVLAYVYDLTETKKLKLKLDSQKEKVYEDTLTKIYNRRFYDEEANHIIKSLMHSNSDLSLLIVDIDHFKEYNDGYGHQMGDKCLKKVASILSKNIGRAGDFIARYGGDEFVIILPNANAEEACMIADQMVKNVRKAKIPHNYSDVADHVTISIGIASGIANSSLTINNSFKAADNALLSAKKAGRNRFILGEMKSKN
jgi:diguanylate cyclase (GGDEF)-like protein/PAS domain S-box-containing protein